MRIFLHSFFNSAFMVHHSAIPTLRKVAEDGFVVVERPSSFVCDTKGVAHTNEGVGNIFDNFDKESIAVIPLRGIMTKYNSWNIGTDTVASWIRQANESDNISGIIIQGDTPGGAVSSLFGISDAISESSKPIYMFVDYMLCSCGYYIGSFCDKIFAINDYCEIGSIGVMATVFRKNKNAMDNYLYYPEDVYPPESPDKNIEIRNSENGDDTLLIEDVLTPLANNFREVVQKNRPQLDITADGVITGKTFFAKDALKVGLIDGIASFDTVVKELKENIATNQTIINTFK